MTVVYSAAHPELGLNKAQSGIECCVCRQGGHFCPSVVMAIGHPNVGICQPCRDGDDCPKFSKIRKDQESPMPLTGVEVDVAMNFLTKNFPTSAAYFADTLSDEEVVNLKKVADLAPAVSWFIEIKVLGRWQMAIFDPVFYEDGELARANARKMSDETASHEARSMIWRKDTAHPGIVAAKKRGRPPGANWKGPQRAEAAKMLQGGASVSETAAAVGLSKTKVVEVRKETPNLPPASVGGASAHKPKQVTSFLPSLNSSLSEVLVVAGKEIVELEARLANLKALVISIEAMGIS